MTVPSRSWLDDPRQLDSTIEVCKSESSSDRMIAKYLLQMRYARPTNVSPGPGFSGANTPTFMDGFLSIVKQIGYNQLLEVTDACTAKICQPLRPRVIPTAAKPDIARLCTLLNRLIDGVLDTCHFADEATSAWEDSYCCPNGFVLFEIEPQIQEIRCHRIDPLYAYWHRAEGREPLHFYVREAVSRTVLTERYPEFEDEIKRASTWQPEHILGVDPPTAGDPDTVCLNRGWRRRTGDEDGRYVVTVGKTVLNGETDEHGERKGEKWDFDFFPVAVARNRWDHKGWAGVPMGRFIAPHHAAINRLARIAEDSFKGAVPIVWSHAQSKLNSISDIPYQIGKWEGTTPPRVEQVNPVSQQVLARIDYHDAKSYALAGINKAIAQGQAPKGVVAAVAMREVVALADARAYEYQRHWESLYRDAGHIIVAFAQKLKSARARSTDANAELMEEIDPKEIKLGRNDYRISYSLTSALAKDVAGLMSDLGEFKDLGFVDTVDMAMAIGDKVPDLQAIMDNVTASKRLAAKMVQDAIEKGEIPTTPSTMQDLDQIIILGKQAWCRAMITPDRYPAKNREALRRLMRIAQARKTQPTLQAQQQTVAPGTPVAPGALLTTGGPGNQRVAHNQYEAASMGIAPGGQPPAPTADGQPPQQ